MNTRAVRRLSAVIGMDFGKLEERMAAHVLNRDNMAEIMEKGIGHMMHKEILIRNNKVPEVMAVPYNNKPSTEIKEMNDKRKPCVVTDTIMSVLRHNFLADMAFVGDRVQIWDDAKQDAYTPILNKLRRVGFKRLGNGHFSCTYTHKQLPDKVIKVSMKRDDAYEKWLDFCEANPMDAVPVVHWRAKWGKHTVVILDKMASLVDSHGNVESNEDRRVRDVFEYVIDSRIMFMQEMAWKERERSWVQKLNETPELVELAQVMLSNVKGVRIDLNMGNIMKLNGKYVVTDPWCEE